MDIKREKYLAKLIKKKGNGFVKVITGLRRAGKSYLLRTQFKKHLLESGVPQENIIEIAFDLQSNKKYLDPDVFSSFAAEKVKGGGPFYFLLDEVQLLPNFEFVLNGLLEYKNADVYVTGSNAKFLSKDIITEFRGRGDEIHIWPLNFSEFMSVYEGDRRDGFDEYALFGGIPLVVLERDEEDKITILKRLFTETYVKDIVGRTKIRNVSELEALLDILSSNIGSLTNPEKLKKTFGSVQNSKITSSTIIKYIDILEDAYLLNSAKRYDVRGKSYISTPMKYYYSDLGLRNARLNFRQQEMPHSMENIVYNELCGRGFNVDVGVVPITEVVDGKQERRQLEIDFVCNKGSKRYYVQSAFALPDEAKQQQEFRPLKKVNDSFKKVVVTKDAPRPYYNDDGILIMNVYDFLLNENSLDF